MIDKRAVQCISSAHLLSDVAMRSCVSLRGARRLATDRSRSTAAITLLATQRACMPSWPMASLQAMQSHARLWQQYVRATMLCRSLLAVVLAPREPVYQL